MKNIIIAFCTLLSLQLSAQNNVGIGTQNPEMKLHVSVADSTVLLLQNSQALQDNASNGLYFKTGNGPIPYTGAIKTIGETSSSARLGLFTFTSSSTSGLKERLTISDVGTVGIGTINPLRDLHVSAPRQELLLLESSLDLEADISNAMIFKTGNATRSYTGAIKTIGTSTSEARLGLFTSAAVTSQGLQERLSILDNGDVGIGTAIPKSKLHIAEQSSNLLSLHNSMPLNQDISSALQFKIGGGENSFFAGTIKAIGTSSNAARLGFYTFASSDESDLRERLSILDNGFVGIGTISPELKMHISSNIHELLTLQNTTNLDLGVENTMYFKNGSADQTKFTGAIKTIGTSSVSSRMGFFTNAASQNSFLTERLTISDNGNVGVGTTDPNTRLHVDGGFILEDGTEGAGKVLTSDADGKASWMKPPLTCNINIGDQIEGGIVFYVDGSGCHGLVAKATDEPSTFNWTTTTGDTDAVGIGLYEGRHNTKKIISKRSANTSPALDVCAALTTSGKTDWYLPSRIELDMMFVNLKLASLGGFANAFYWSSSEANALTAWTQNFTDGTQDGLLPFNKTATSNRVRAIRAF